MRIIEKDRFEVARAYDEKEIIRNELRGIVAVVSHILDRTSGVLEGMVF